LDRALAEELEVAGTILADVTDSLRGLEPELGLEIEDATGIRFEAEVIRPDAAGNRPEDAATLLEAAGIIVGEEAVLLPETILGRVSSLFSRIQKYLHCNRNSFHHPIEYPFF
jgi:hypothetical protein